MHRMSYRTWTWMAIGMAAALAMGLLLGTPAQANPIPTFGARLSENQVHGYQWPLGETVTLTIDDPSNGTGVDYEDTQLVGAAPWNSEETFVVFDLQDAFQLLPGQLITLSDSTTAKSHTVIAVAVTSVNLVADTVAGTASPGDVVVNIWDAAGGASRHELTDSLGNWSADFSGPGDEGGESATYDIDLGTRGEALQNDGDGDFTNVSWQVPNPWLDARPSDERVDASHWTPEATVTLTIDDDGNAGNGVLYTDSASTDQWGDVQFRLEGIFDIQAGHVVTLSDGTFTKMHTVTDLEMRMADHESDVIWGVAHPGSPLHLELENPDVAQDVTTDSTGTWSVNFAELSVDILLGTKGQVTQADEDGDRTMVDLSMPYSFLVALDDNPALPPSYYISIPMWPGQRPWPKPVPFTFTLTIDDPTTPEVPDYTEQRLVTSTERFVEFKLTSLSIPQRGHMVTITDGEITKRHRVVDVLITSVNEANDTIYGHGDPDADVRVEVCDESGSCVDDEVHPDAAGQWSIAFSGEADIRPGMLVRAQQGDPDGENTFSCWTLPLDSDGDGVYDGVDNAPSDYNPDQSDLDGDGVGDVADPCPSDLSDTCDANRSAAESVGPGGGTLTTPDGSVAIAIPAGALANDTSISITDLGSGYELTTDLGQATAVFGVEVGPPGTVFALPITIVFAWEDSDGDGVVDNTDLKEPDLLISKDGVIITSRCAVDAGCDASANTFTFQVSGLSKLALVSVHNVAPTITSITAPLEPVQVNSSVQVSGDFVDPWPPGTHTALWDWGDGTTSKGVVSEADGSGTIAGSHSYDIPGIYTLALTVIDQYSASHSAESEYLVVYEPEGGFVTGGGWIDSPPGAYAPAPSLSGKANFGFVSKYKKGADVPTGETEFQFKVADLRIHSDSYQWLVVVGAKAQFKGVGTINGEGDYGFMITVIDVALTPDADTDKFRIKIWDWEDGTIVYDNQMGDADNVEPTTVTGGGSIVVHKAK
jgi:hypothetical protein